MPAFDTTSFEASIVQAKDVEFTAKNSGYYLVWVNGIKISQHITEREALEKATNLVNATDIVKVTHDYEVSIELKGVTPGPVIDDINITTSVDDLQVNSNMSTITITQPPFDPVPDPFTFTDQLDVTEGSVRTSLPVDIKGINAPATITVFGTTGLYNINGGAYTSNPGTVNKGDQITARHTATTGTNQRDTIVTIGGISDTFTSTTEVVAGPWILPSDHSIKRVDLHRIYPQSNAGTHARHLWAHPDFQYRIPIGVQGGAYPYKYEITAGPPGAVIGETLDIDGNGIHTPGEYYGVIRWTPQASSGSEHFTVVVTDQNLNSVTFDWDTEIDASKFTFIQEGAAGGGTGGISDPLQTMDDWYQNETNTDYKDQIVVFMAGNYTLIPSNFWAGGNRWTIQLNTNYKTHSLIGIPDAMPTIDMSRGSIGAGNNLNDIFIGEIHFDGYQTIPSQEKNSVQLTLGQPGYRCTIFQTTHSNMEIGTAGDSNPGCISILGDATDSPGVNYLHIFKPTFNSIHLDNGGQGSLIDIYNSDRVLIEHCFGDSTNDAYAGIWIKACRSNTTVRHNEINGGALSLMTFGDVGSKPPVYFNNEWCYNKMVRGLTAGGIGLLFSSLERGNDESGDVNNSLYRNTITGPSCGVEDFTGGNRPKFLYDSNVIVSSETSGVSYDDSLVISTLPVDSPGGLIAVQAASATQTFADVGFGATGKLIGSARTTYLGRVGSEIGGDDAT